MEGILYNLIGLWLMNTHRWAYQSFVNNAHCYRWFNKYRFSIDRCLRMLSLSKYD